jgi:hypothetical protein
MSLVASAGELRARVPVAQKSLAGLTDSLAAELDETILRQPMLPREKAKLTRAGGRCVQDGLPLDFDPYSPHKHRCTRCGATYSGDEHYRWWIMSQQLFLAERAVHGALLSALSAGEHFADFTESLLRQYASLYLSFPNSDNVLGPGRLFFSTYLESIWLLQICVALDLLEASGRVSPVGDAVRERIIDPASRLIATYDEGTSNRQAWNSAALLAAAKLLGDEDEFDRAALRAESLMHESLLRDGSWYEGENYHVFAHRGLWYVVEICARSGYSLSADVLARYQLGFATPFRTALPDMTMLARRDSQYGVSFRQWRFAELCELGIAREPSGAAAAQLLPVLGQLYSFGGSAESAGRSLSTAEVERNLPAAALSRRTLGWKSLLHALPELPAVAAASQEFTQSTLLESQGIAVFRREGGKVYLALDYGHHGGGHGHPDRLNVSFQVGNARWLEDAGTGSYVDRSLFWYRSNLAHNAPMAGWRAQARAHGELRGAAEDGSTGYVQATFSDPAAAVTWSRELLATDSYFVDELTWLCDAASTVQLPLHISPEAVEVLNARVEGAAPDTPGNEEGSRWLPLQFHPMAATELTEVGSGDHTTGQPRGWQSVDGADEGLQYVSQQLCAEVPNNALLRLKSRMDDKLLTSFVLVPDGAVIWRMRGPGPPGTADREFLLFDFHQAINGGVTFLHDWGGSVTSVAQRDVTLTVQMRDGVNHVHQRGGSRWRLSSSAPPKKEKEFRRQLLRDCRPAMVRETLNQPGHGAPARDPRGANVVQIPINLQLGEEHFRRSELDWIEHGRPTAVVALTSDSGSLLITAQVRNATRNLAPQRDAPWLDNEHPDINSDGLQIHIVRPGTSDEAIASAAFILVPEENGRVRVTARTSELNESLIEAGWHPTENGYTLAVRLKRDFVQPTPDSFFLLDIVVNLLANGRERRSGQLVMSGAIGEWIYLMGDRQAPARLIPFRFG